VKDLKDLYDEWFTYPKWTFQEAAYLFNGQDPTKREKEPLSDIGTRRNIPFYKSLDDLHELKLSPREQKVFKTYHIFLRVDWKRYVDMNTDPNFCYRKAANPCVFLSLAKDMQLELPDELLRKAEKINPRVEESEVDKDVSIGERRANVLKAWLASNNPEGHPLEKTRMGLWNALSSIDGQAFSPKSPHTINDFFKSQRYCTFKPGRRKGG